MKITWMEGEYRSTRVDYATRFPSNTALIQTVQYDLCHPNQICIWHQKEVGTLCNDTKMNDMLGNDVVCFAFIKYTRVKILSNP